ncbi:MAG: hypothetical protein IJ620_04940 [Bacteroidales bacterium]|nr:hypothetical protein [Bacteroidales bacterium]
MDYPDIHKNIYKQEGIAAKTVPQWWAMAGCIIGVVGLLLLLRYPDAGAGVNALLTTLTVTGLFCLLTLIGYHTIGDHRIPYRKSDGDRLYHSVHYYANAALPQLSATLEQGDTEHLEHIKGSPTPQIALVVYRNDARTSYYAQLMRDKDGKLIPISPIYNLTKKEEKS